MRNYTSIRAFQVADQLVVRVYELSADLPAAERFGLQAQLRRAAVSVPTNLVEGSRRSGDRDFARFVNTAKASAAEVQYLLGLARRLDYLDAKASKALERDYGALQMSLHRYEIALR